MKEQYRRLIEGFVACWPEDPAPDDLLEAVRGLPEVGKLPPPWVTWTLVRLIGRLGSESIETISRRKSALYSPPGSPERVRMIEAARPDPDPGYPHFEIDLDDEREHHIGYGYSFRYNALNPSYAESSDPINYWMTGRLPFVFVPEFLGNFRFRYRYTVSEGRRGGVRRATSSRR